MKFIKLAALAALCLPLGSCFFAPGKFNSTLELRRDGRFSFAYTGEVLFFEGKQRGAAFDDKCFGSPPTADREEDPISESLPSSTLARPSSPERDATRDAAEDAELLDIARETAERPCTPAELAAQRQQRERQAKEEAAMMAAVLGFDPDDPRSIEAYVSELKKHPGWREVTHKGGNRFQVNYRLNGTADRDFLFPVFDNVVVHTPFVTMRPRNDGSAEVRAPAFGGGGLGSLGGLLGPLGRPGSGNGDDPFSQLLNGTDGTFTLVTDGVIRTNNTAEGPTTKGGDKVLTWRVLATSREAPRALVQLR